MITFKRLTLDDSDVLQSVLERAVKYSFYADGLDYVPKESAKTVLIEIPPGISYEDKYVFLISNNECPVGVIDVINGYPDLETAFIGLLLIAEDMHGHGLGRLSYEKLELFIRDELEMNKIMLAYLESNPVEGFWSKLGYSKIEEKRPYDGLNRKTFSQRMIKII